MPDTHVICSQRNMVQFHPAGSRSQSGQCPNARLRIEAHQTGGDCSDHRIRHLGIFAAMLTFACQIQNLAVSSFRFACTIKNLREMRLPLNTYWLPIANCLE